MVGVVPPLDATGEVAATDVTPVLAIVIDPAPFVILMPVPLLSVACVYAEVVVLPIKS
jgi:hypothetical protein